jgi:hypothetical protein
VKEKQGEDKQNNPMTNRIYNKEKENEPERI